MVSMVIVVDDVAVVTTISSVPDNRLGAMRVSDDESLDAAGSLSLRVSHHRRTGRLTTPQWLRLASVSITCGVLTFGIVTAVAVVHRRDAADAVGGGGPPLFFWAPKGFLSPAPAGAGPRAPFLPGRGAER